MFHSAALKLTLWYLAIIMSVSLLFSSLLYHVSMDNMGRSVNRQIGYFNNFLGPGDYNAYTLFRQHQLEQDRDRLRANLFIFNLLVLGAGGAASYWLARRTLEPIEIALESQTRFAADASHELRTPLTAIQAENEVALRNPNLKKSQAVELLKSNLEEVAKLKALSEGLLRLANGNGKIDNPRPVSLKEVVQASIDRLSKTADLKRIKVIDKTGDLTLSGEPESLTELFSIFIDNSLKYSSAKSQVIISSQKHHKDIRVKISDRGSGIPPNDLPVIFERFYRSERSRSREDTGGYGLGLAIAKKIVEAHRGHIEVSSTVGRGSSFIVHLPSA